MASLRDQAESGSTDGVSLVWGVWPRTWVEQVKLSIPNGIMYTPGANGDSVYRLGYNPLVCTQSGCAGVANPFGSMDYGNKMWVCVLCGNRNNLPQSYQHASHQSPPLEMMDEHTTIEYETKSDHTLSAPTLLFVIDTAVADEELEAVKAAIEQALTLLPEDCMVGLITFGKHVSVHEIGFTECNKCIVFRGDIHGKEETEKNFTVDRVKHLLGITAENNGISRYFLPIKDVLNEFHEILDDINIDQWTPKRACRPEKCTGVASLVAVALMESCLQGHAGRIMLFSGGPPTVGPGRVVEVSLKKHLRGHKDIVRGRAPLHEPAKNFYGDLSTRCAGNSHVFDIFACSLDQLGIAEQRIMCDNTGGCMVLSDTFTTRVFEDSFAGLFYNKWVPFTEQEMEHYPDDPDQGREELAMAFNGEIRVRCSRHIKVAGCLGAVSSMKETATNCISKKEQGLGGTSKWSIGGLFPNTSMCFIFHAAAEPDKDGQGVDNETYGYAQFVTTWTSAMGYNITRVTTIAVQLADASRSQGLQRVVDSFDAQTASVVLARSATFKADNDWDPDLLRWLDNSLITVSTKVASAPSQNPDAVMLPASFDTFPQFIYYLRRSQFIQVFNYSPDETAFFRACLMREPVASAMMMIQPSLVGYDITESWAEDDAEQSNFAVGDVPLELTSRHPKRVLLLDTFFHLVIWYGRQVAKWRNQELWKQEEEDGHKPFEWFKDFLATPRDEANQRAANRFPCPNLIECDENSGQQRFLIAKLNPDQAAQDPHMNPEDQAIGDVWSDDVSLQNFRRHLFRTVITNKANQ